MTGSSGLAIICCLLEWHDPPFQQAWYAGAFMKGTWTTIVVTFYETFQGTKYTSQVKSPTKMKMYILT